MGSNQFLVDLGNAKCLTLKIIEGPNLGEIFTAQFPRGKSNVGRKPTNDISFPEDQHLSNMHSTIFSIEGVWYIEDLGTTNGYSQS
jgi:predicted component of type VI protein secretion system